MSDNERKYIDWEAWNNATYQRVDFWLNKYDRGECIENYIPPDDSQEEEIKPELPKRCPKIDEVLFYKCSFVEVYFMKGF